MWRRRARTARAGVLLMCVLGIASCTDDGSQQQTPTTSAPEPVPATPIGARVGVVLPPTTDLDPAVLAELGGQLDQLADTTGDAVRELRGYPTADPRFVGDVTRWLAERDTELVCVLGDRAEDAAVALATLYRGIRICALPTGAPSPEADDRPGGRDEVLRVELRVEELGYLIGVAARVQARSGPVGLVLGGDELPDDRFRLGLLAGLAGAEVVEADVPNDEEVTLTDRAEAVLAADASVVVVDGAIGASEAVEAIDGRAEVLAPEAVVTASSASAVVLSWNVRWDRALAGPLASLAGESDTVQHTSSGWTEDVFELTLGRAALEPVAPALDLVTSGLTAGVLDPSVPAGSTPPASGADPDAGPPDDPSTPDGPEPADPEPVELDASRPG